MPFIKPLLKIAFLTLLVWCTSCVKDVDLDQYEEIIISPEAALDLIYFTVTAEDFTGGSGGEVTARDETRLEFLDDDYIQDGLVRSDFNFRLTNTFQSPITATIRFLSASNSVQHTIVIPVGPGTIEAPATVDYTEIINKDQINRIKRSITLSVEITRHDPFAVEGALQLESKGFYYFEFQ